MTRQIKIIILIIFCWSIQFAIAQDNTSKWQKTWVYKIDKMLTDWYFNSKTDTLYVVRPNYKWILRGVGSLSGSSMFLKGNNNSKPFCSSLTPFSKGSFSIGVDYLGLYLGLSANPDSWSGKYKDHEFNFGLYTNRVGIDFMYHDQQSASGWLENEDNNKVHLPQGILTSKTFNINTYYAFNRKKFSIPATAFQQSFIQKRSAGSWLMGLSFWGQWADIGKDLSNILSIEEYKSLNVSIGCGYGYNWVLSKNLAFHISAIPTVIIWSHTNMRNGTEWNNISSHFTDFLITSRASLVGNFNRYVVGITFMSSISAIGNTDRFHVNTGKWRVRLHFGWRF